MSLKRKNPYASSSSPAPSMQTKPPAAAVAPQAAASVAPARTGVPLAAEAAVLPPDALQVALASPLETPKRKPDSVGDAGSPRLAEEIERLTEERLFRYQEFILTIQQQTGVSADVLSVLREYPYHGDDSRTAEALNVLIGAGLAHASGLTARGKLLRQKISKTD